MGNSETYGMTEALFRRYEPLALLKEEEAGVTVLAVRDRDSRRKLLMKRSETPEGMDLMKNECRMLSQIHAQDDVSAFARLFPAIRGSGEDGGFWFVRDWIEGHTIAEQTESGREEPGMSRMEALGCLISVTELLSFLHGLQPPLIHRDIKPQNIVVDPCGQCYIIDLGISRRYRAGQETDTVVSGTQATSPPEQFGYAQTDARSDVYSCGVLLRYALTGDYSEASDAALSEDLRRIIRKATMFDPDRRYQTADEMKRDLLAARYGLCLPQVERSRRKTVFAVCLFAVLLFFAAAPWIDRLDLPGRIAAWTNAPYTFREPLIENAVREALGKPEGSITQDDLAQVTALHIYGKQVFQYEEQFWLRGNNDYCYIDAFRESGLYLENGGIVSLEDIRHMPNLRDLSLYNQNISDIEALRDTEIVRLGLAHNPIISLAPLRGNGSIVCLNISCLPLDSLSDVSTLSGLRELNISSMHVNSVELLTSLLLKRLQMYEVSLQNEWELQRMTGLETLEIQNLTPEGISALAALPHLKELTVTHPLGLPLKAFEPLNMLERLYLEGSETFVPENGTVRLPNLSYLEMNNGHFPHFRWLSGFPRLRQLCILNAECDSLDGLETPPLLMEIICTSPLADRIRAAFPDAVWTVH